MTKKAPVVVVVELNGGNDYLNTVIPYADPNYYDNRKALRINENEVLKLDDELGLNPHMGPMKDLYEAGNLAIIHGVGYGKSFALAFSIYGHLAYLRAPGIGGGRVDRAVGTRN